MWWLPDRAAVQEDAQLEEQEHLAANARLTTLAHEVSRDRASTTNRPARRPARMGDRPC
jgi:hypothetical protein